MKKTTNATKRLPDHANLDQLKKQAKSLLKALKGAEDKALSRVSVLPKALQNLDAYKLCHAQLILAREYGFSSWTQLKNHIEHAKASSTPEASERLEFGSAPFSVATIPARDFVLMPGTVFPIFVGREKSLAAIQHALDDGGVLFVLSQRDPQTPEPVHDDVYQMGTLATIEDVVDIPDGSQKVLLRGHVRARVLKTDFTHDHWRATVQRVEESSIEDDATWRLSRAIELVETAAVQQLLAVPLGLQTIEDLKSIDDPGTFADRVIPLLKLDLANRQALLEQEHPYRRLEHLIDVLEDHVSV